MWLVKFQRRVEFEAENSLQERVQVSSPVLNGIRTTVTSGNSSPNLKSTSDRKFSQGIYIYSSRQKHFWLTQLIGSEQLITLAKSP